ncbi:nitrogen fixation protein NifQ [Pectobacterium cacticida]|uniref:Nitrogen fixation protein NifQ n=1 Tax=Pectobacterium cacticida TaxID=69221 RepID=A0ABZ2G7S9_9GAMM|nr:nitrogen fixation protein NifQ [Pectobacterium cacticida]UYX05429.1 nitrogen fixation protein NifQ [Pectobacterium cacticida]
MNGAQGWLRRLVSLHLAGRSHFPPQMGLDDAAWQALLQYTGHTAPMLSTWQLEQQKLLGLLQQTRTREREQLARWLSQSQVPEAAPMHALIATASMGFDHLWQDLGLDSRAELRDLMADCFPELVRLNHQNMRWKKFFYRQQCIGSLGEIVCRSPSCNECCEWNTCFAPEE